MMIVELFMYYFLIGAKVFKYFTVGVNLVGTVFWFYNYSIFSTTICLVIAFLQLYLAAFALTSDIRTGRM